MRVTQQNCFGMRCKYKGTYVINTSFLTDLEPYVNISTTHYDPVYDLMLRIKNRTDYECPVVKNTMGINNYQSTIVDEPV